MRRTDYYLVLSLVNFVNCHVLILNMMNCKGYTGRCAALVAGALAAGAPRSVDRYSRRQRYDNKSVSHIYIFYLTLNSHHSAYQVLSFIKYPRSVHRVRPAHKYKLKAIQMWIL